MAKDNKSPDTTSDAYDLMVPRWGLIDTVLTGTEAMRAAGPTLLPQHEQESGYNYRIRLETNVLYNYLESTLNDLSAKPFQEEPVVDEAVPKWFTDTFFNDVDRQGNSLLVFAKREFRTGLAKGMAHVLVEMPRVKEPVAGEVVQPRTLADDAADKMEPYWISIKPEQVIFAREVVVGGRRQYSHVRIMETVREADDFGEIEKKQIRILEPGTVSIWQLVKEKSKKEVWRLVDSWTTGLPYVPLFTFYAGERVQVGEIKPQLLDLAYMNVTHWQSAADQRNILRVARFPILACSGAVKEEGDDVILSPNKTLYNAEPTARFYYVEHTGKAIDAGRMDLKDLEEKMAAYGGTFLEDDPGNPTATAKAIDTADSVSTLASDVGLFEDTLERAMQATADWKKLGVEDVGGVAFCKSYTPDMPDTAGMAALAAARTGKDISRNTLLRALLEREVLPEDFDIKQNEKELEEESTKAQEDAQAALEHAASIVPATDPNAVPGQKPVPTKKKVEDPKKK